MKDSTKIWIGEQINIALLKKNIKQKELAKAIGVTDNTISYFVSGSRTPNTEQIIEIAKFLGVSTDYLLNGACDEPEDDNYFVFRVGQLLKQNNIKQTELGKILGVTRQTISLYMAGKAIPNINALKKLSNFFDVSADWLLGLSDRRKKEI